MAKKFVQIAVDSAEDGHLWALDDQGNVYMFGPLDGDSDHPCWQQIEGDDKRYSLKDLEKLRK